MKKIIQFNILTILLIFLSATFFNCRKNIDDPIIGTENPVYVESSVYGQVIDPSGNPAEGVQVSFNSSSVTTDKYGVYILNNQLMNKQGAQIKFKKSAYFEIYKTVIPIKGKMVNVGARLITKKLTKTIQASTGGLVESNGTATVKFQANSFITSNSQTYTGPVNVYSYYLNPESNETQAEMPGNLTGRNSKGEFVILRTQGMLKVELEDATGNSLKLNPSTPAELSIPIQSTLDSKALSSIPLWYFDATKGGWIEEGSAARVGNRYIGNVSHFTYWNWDFQFQSINLKFRFVDKNGNPLGNVGFDIQDLTNGGHGSGASNPDGTFEGKIPENSNFKMLLFDCGGSTLKTFQSSNTDLDLGDIVIDLLSLKVKANIIDCNNNPLINGVAILNNGNGVVGIYPIQGNNNLEFSVIICNPTTFTLKVVDYANLKENTTNFSTNNQNLIDLGTITVCEELKDYVKITILGKDIVKLGTLLKSNSSTEYYLEGVGKDSSNIHFTIPDINLGQKIPILIYFYEEILNVQFYCGQNCSAVNINITQTGPIGTQLKGTFAGDLPNNNPNGPQGTIHFEGEFSVERKQ